MKESTELRDKIRNTFEKHDVENIALQNALIEILEYALINEDPSSSSTDVLSEKMRDKPTDE